MLWTAYVSAFLIILTTALIYPIDAYTANGLPRWINLSSLLNGACSESPGELLVARIGGVGYVLAFNFMYEAFRRLYWADDQKVKYWIGTTAILALYLVLEFPSGKSLGTDIVHYTATAIAMVLLLVYAIMNFETRKLPFTMSQDLATVGMFAATIALIISYFLGEADKFGWNGFVASQLAYGISFVIFLVSWGTNRSGPSRPHWAHLLE